MPSRFAGLRLSVMMFLQFFIWGAYLVPMGKYLATLFAGNPELGPITASAYSTNSIAAIVSPVIVGLVADRFFSGQRLMGVLHLVGGVLLFWLATITDPAAFFWVLLAYSLCYMPTLALANSVSFDNLRNPEQSFPLVRVWGTLGWILSGFAVGLGLPLITGVDDPGSTALPFQLAGGASILLGVYAFTLPDSPPKSKGEEIKFGRILGLDALGLLKQPSFLVFVICSFLICIPLAVYYGWTNRFIAEKGVEASETVMAFGQVSEIVFMVLLPFFLQRFAVKWILLIGMLAWVARYALFAAGADASIIWMFYLGILLHGVCYDFFFVTGQLYTDRKAGLRLRASAQGFITLVTYGAGMLVGNIIGGILEKRNTFENAAGDLVLDWTGFWMIPAGAAFLVALLFLVLFRDPVRLDEETRPSD